MSLLILTWETPVGLMIRGLFHIASHNAGGGGRYVATYAVYLDLNLV